ncbi:MAG TPA: hypothetical protein VFS01_14600 [Rhizomicrobium sp.]|nr:hypothetical protein [Rhizomicrobium sp.]
MTHGTATIRSNSATVLWRILFLLCALAVPAAAQEAVTVEKGRGLVGLWRIEVPHGIRVTFFHDTQFGEMRPVFCRIGGAGNIHCLNGGFSREGTVSVDGKIVHIAWGTAMARFVIDGISDGETIAGHFSFKFSGISHDAPSPSVSTRVGSLGNQASSQAAAMMARLKNTPPPALEGLGTLEDVSYLGTSPRLDGGGDADYFRVYALEFAGGERVCGVHEDSFTCV